MNFNALQLKALMLSVITEIKFGQPLDRNAIGVKKAFKAATGLKPKASNVDVLKHIYQCYKDNNQEQNAFDTVTKFQVDFLVFDEPAPAKYTWAKDKNFA